MVGLGRMVEAGAGQTGHGAPRQGGVGTYTQRRLALCRFPATKTPPRKAERKAALLEPVLTLDPDHCGDAAGPYLTARCR
jgi:hypothetical protein